MFNNPSVLVENPATRFLRLIASATEMEMSMNALDQREAANEPLKLNGARRESSPLLP